MAAPFRFDRSFELAATPDELWRALAQTDRYAEWWSWLRTFDAPGLHEGTVANCVVQAPLPYSLRFAVTVGQVVPNELVDTMVTGDLEGPARLEVMASSGGSTARLVWSLELRDTMLRSFATLARPAMVWAHDRVVASGLRQFERGAVDPSR